MALITSDWVPSGGNIAFFDGVAAAAASTAAGAADEAGKKRLGKALAVSLRSRDSVGRTPLHYAAMYGDSATEDQGIAVTSAVLGLAAVLPSLGVAAVDLDKVSHGSQLQSLWIIPAAAVS